MISKISVLQIFLLNCKLLNCIGQSKATLEIISDSLLTLQMMEKTKVGSNSMHFYFYIYIKQFINSHFNMYFFLIDFNLAFKIHVRKVLKKSDFALQYCRHTLIKNFIYIGNMCYLLHPKHVYFGIIQILRCHY